MQEQEQRKLVHIVFEWSLIIKSIDGVLETIAGLLLLFGRNLINSAVLFITSGEREEDPHDLVVNYLLNFSHSLTVNPQTFAIVWLLAHGIVKIVLAVSLLKDKLWAYPVALVIFSLFAVYELYRCFINFSPLILFFVVFDIAVIIIISLEAKYHKKRLWNTI